MSPPRAAAVQDALAAERVPAPPPGFAVRTVAACDASYLPGSDRVFAAVVVCSYPDLEVRERRTARGRSTFPYVPGLLTFREGPILLRALRRLRRRPDVLLVDGQGIAHPRGMGLAAHVGILLDLPSVGCAKSLLAGEHAPVGRHRGAWSPLRLGGEVVGAVVRTREGVRPVVVSPGHRMDVETAVAVVLGCSRGYRIPEPLRLCHADAGRLRREAAPEGRPPQRRATADAPTRMRARYGPASSASRETRS